MLPPKLTAGQYPIAILAAFRSVLLSLDRHCLCELDTFRAAVLGKLKQSMKQELNTWIGSFTGLALL